VNNLHITYTYNRIYLHAINYTKNAPHHITINAYFLKMISEESVMDVMNNILGHSIDREMAQDILNYKMVDDKDVTVLFSYT